MKTRKLLAILTAVAMLFSLSAMTGCNENNPNTTGTTTGGTGDGTPSDGEGEEKFAEYQDFDFGFVKFTDGEFLIEAGADIKVGGNLNEARDNKDEGGGASDSIRIAGFQGYTSSDGYPDDPEANFLTLISQNGEFWDNVSKIEASFYIVSDSDESSPLDITNVEAFYQGGRDAGYDFRMFGENLLEQHGDHECGEDDCEGEDCNKCGFQFGDIMDIVWDFDKYKEDVTERQSKDTFANPPVESEPGNGNWGGGGINKFGITIKNESFINDFKGKIFFTEVKVYVHDKEAVMEWIEKVEEEMEIKMDPDMLDRIIEV
jgi:hypothetical protein